jgi:hypothetical protein
MQSDYINFDFASFLHTQVYVMSKNSVAGPNLTYSLSLQGISFMSACFIKVSTLRSLFKAAF